MGLLKNIPVDGPAAIKDLIKSKNNQVVSMALSKSEHVQISIFTFANQETVSKEAYFGDVMYLVVEGETYIKQSNRTDLLKEGDVLMVPAETLHEIGGKDSFKVLQILVKA